jgi:cytochrome bd-type quinol oxidase subunit 2
LPVPGEAAVTATEAAEDHVPRVSAHRGPHPLTEQPAVVGLVGVATALLAIGISQDMTLQGRLRHAVVLAHLGSLVVGFGAVIVINMYGVLWLAGRRGVTEVRRLAQAAHILVWVGFVGLLATGALLHPSLSRAHTKVKMILVVVAAVNGAWETALLNRLNDLPASASARDHPSLVRAALASGAVSQLCWWGATIAGVVTTTKR